MNAPTFLLVLHWVAGLVVLGGGLQRLEVIAPLAKGLKAKDRARAIAEAGAWISACIGAAGAIITPLMPLEKPTLQDACVLVGVAVLILSGRLKARSCQT